MSEWSKKIDFSWSIPEWADHVLDNFVEEHSVEVGDQRDSL
jgi:hypothetical protein